MATDQFISPFPEDIDREAFGAWLSGFTDADGSFSLHLYQSSAGCPTPLAIYSIYLRDDDFAILQQIQSFLGCGRIDHISRADQRAKGHDTKDCYSFNVRRVAQLISCVLPHFQRFPLLAKKRRDLAVFREAVLFLHRCTTGPRLHKGRKGATVWSPQRLDYFRALIETLDATRAYLAPEIPLPEPPPPEPGLFD